MKTYRYPAEYAEKRARTTSRIVLLVATASIILVVSWQIATNPSLERMITGVVGGAILLLSEKA